MRPRSLFPSTLALLLLTSCGQGTSPANEAQPSADLPTPLKTEPAAITPVDRPSPVASASSGLTPEAERGEKGARDVLLSFATALEQGEFDSAWTLLSPGDQKKWSRSQFAALFTGLGTITVAVPAGSLEGAAGSSYYSTSVTVSGDAKGQGRSRLAGQAVLRRVNDVDGSSAAERRWHFESLTLAPTVG